MQELCWARNGRVFGQIPSIMTRFGTEGSVACRAVASAEADSNPLAPTTFLRSIPVTWVTVKSQTSVTDLGLFSCHAVSCQLRHSTLTTMKSTAVPLGVIV